MSSDTGIRGWFGTILEDGEVTWTLLLSRIALSGIALWIFTFFAMAFGDRADDVFVLIAGAIAFSISAFLVRLAKLGPMAFTNAKLEREGKLLFEGLEQHDKILAEKMFALLGGGAGVGAIVLTPDLAMLLKWRVLVPVGKGVVQYVSNDTGCMNNVAHLVSQKLDANQAYLVQPGMVRESLRYYLCVKNDVRSHFQSDVDILRRYRFKHGAA